MCSKCEYNSIEAEMNSRREEFLSGEALSGLLNGVEIMYMIGGMRKREYLLGEGL
jgi:hypothetical protein